MSKYDPLWDFVQSRQESSFKLTFEDIQCIVGMPKDHSFLKCKRSLRTTDMRSEKYQRKSRR